MQANPFDAAVTVHEGGYDWPLQEWRRYYTFNVLGTHAITHENFLKEFPQVSAALAESDAKYAQLNALLNNPQGAAAIVEVVTHLMAGKPITLTETYTPADTTPPTDTHTHKAMLHKNGNGKTDAGGDGHKHVIQDGKCLDCNGHTHDMAGMASETADDEPDGDGAQ